jgi:hypothetical protein
MNSTARRNPNRFSRSEDGRDLSSQLEPFDDFGSFSDADLERVTKEWRVKAARGERDAFGIAHECEVELRRRERLRDEALPDSVALEEASKSKATGRSWWKFWQGARS